MHRQNKRESFNILHLILDNTAILCSYCIADKLYMLVMKKSIFAEHLWIYVIFTMLFSLSMLLMRIYGRVQAVILLIDSLSDSCICTLVPSQIKNMRVAES